MNKSKSKKKFRVISLFSGAGGMDLGFINAGFEIVWANDFFKEAVESYKKNVDDRIVYGDITKIDSSEMPDDIDLVIGGFPCQGFSVANTKRSMKDERNFLYKEMLRVIDDSGEDYLYSAIQPSSLENSTLCGRWEIVEDNENKDLEKALKLSY